MKRADFLARARKRDLWVAAQRQTRTLQSIATELGVSRERVRQLERRGLRHLANTLGPTDIATLIGRAARQ